MESLFLMTRNLLGEACLARLPQDSSTSHRIRSAAILVLASYEQHELVHVLRRYQSVGDLVPQYQSWKGRG